MFRLIAISCFSVLFARMIVGAAATADDASTIRFSRDILPVLSENCFFCHGPDEKKRMAELRLDTQEGAASVINRQNPLQSPLLQRILSHDPDAVMPPVDSNRALTAAQKSTVQQWIVQGAEWGQHWSFEPLRTPPVPPPAFAEFPVYNPIDAFVQHKLSQKKMKPSDQAERRTLIRRLSLDLTGLPPTIAEVDQFLADDSDMAYERVVDRLLASEAFGERMAWDWLDAARYADSNGYQGDRERTMWPWRDWVVDAFNANMPFDQFTTLQLAGDLLPDASQEQILATGFCRNHMINGEGGRIAEENRVDYVMDMSETMGTVWLGLTLNCCRCHDHKYDPLTQNDYYQFFAFFNQTPVQGGGGDPQTAPVQPVPTESQKQQLADVQRQLTDVEQALAARKRVLAGTVDSESALNQDSEFTDLKKQQDTFLKQRTTINQSIAKVMVMADQSKWRSTYVLNRGLYNDVTDREVTALTPASLPPMSSSSEHHNRLDLANWLMSDDHPLTARVTVNRFWQQLFGLGLVKTTEDFGVQAEYPEYRDLLDWLAADFRANGWDVKRLIRTIVTSHTYRQSSAIRSTEVEHGRPLNPAEVDPENRLLARASRFRMPSWMLRDSALAVSGLLNDRIGGPPVKTYQPPGVWEEATFGNKKHTPDGGDKLYRRSLYIFWRRIIAPTLFFDSASRQSCTVRSSRTNTPLHALLTLNETTYVESARALAQQLLLDVTLVTDEQRTMRLFQTVLSRPATERESAIVIAGVQRSLAEYEADPESASQLLSAGESDRDETPTPSIHAAWTTACLTVLNLDEALSRE
ncbi:MAG: PSD1 and planctomycete cytochrome C domain-containing protein [Planctomycetaceae bacterium]